MLRVVLGCGGGSGNEGGARQQGHHMACALVKGYCLSLRYTRREAPDDGLEDDGIERRGGQLGRLSVRAIRCEKGESEGGRGRLL